MLKKTIIVALLAIGGLHGFAANAAATTAATTPVAAAAPAFVLSVQKIVLKDGKELRVDAAGAEPGETLEYRAEYTNLGKTTMTNVLLTLPLPEQTAFIAGSGHPSGMTASTRAVKNVFRAPQAPTAAATPGDAYDALRWSIDTLAPGRTAVVSARVRVDAMAQQKTPAAK